MGSGGSQRYRAVANWDGKQAMTACCLFQVNALEIPSESRRQQLQIREVLSHSVSFHGGALPQEAVSDGHSFKTGQEKIIKGNLFKGCCLHRH